jgi:AcrR family transcriptional regulator
MARNTKPEPAARPRRRATERLDAILDAAHAEFAAHGFALARLDDVARQAHVAKGTIYLYFENKEELFRAVVRRSIVPLVANAGDQIDRFEGTTEELLRMLLGVVRRGFADPGIRAIVRLVIAEAGRFPDLAEFYHREVISRGIGAMRRLLARGIERGELKPGALAKYPHLLIAPALLGLVWQDTFEQFEHLDFGGLLEAHIETLLHGIGGPET